MVNLDLTPFTGIVTAISALTCLVVMQEVTRESGIRCKYGIIQLCQRFSLAVLAIALAYDCYNTISTGSDPRPGDFFVHVALLLVLVCWAYRKHLFASSFKLKAGPFGVLHNLDEARKAAKLNQRVID
jgi:hypothetical protein